MPEDFQEQALVILRLVFAPAAGASLVVMLAVRLFGGERLAPLAAGLAVAAGLFTGNYFSGLMAEAAHLEHPALNNLRPILHQVLEQKPAVSDVPHDPSAIQLAIPQRHYWLPWVAVLAMLIEVSVRCPIVPVSAGWVVRAFAAVFAARLLTPDSYRVDFPESIWLLAAVIILEWGVLIVFARQWPDSTAGIVMALCLAATTLIISQQSAGPSLGEMSVLCFAAILGPPLVAWRWPGDTGPGVAAVAVLLPALLLMGHEAADPPRQLLNFLLIGLAPLALIPMFMPPLVEQTGFKRWLLALVLPLIPVGLAVFWVVQETPLPGFGK